MKAGPRQTVMTVIIIRKKLIQNSYWRSRSAAENHESIYFGIFKLVRA